MRFACAVILMLAACDSPSPQFARATPTMLTRGGYDITVRQADGRVEAVRHGWARQADKPHLRALLMQAMRDVTGCDLRENSVQGDIGVLRARVSCKG